MAKITRLTPILPVLTVFAASLMVLGGLRAEDAPKTEDAPKCLPPAATAVATEGPTCSKAGVAQDASQETSYPAQAFQVKVSEPMQRIVTYVSDRLMEGGSPAFSEDEIREAAGVTEEEYQTLRKTGELEDSVMRTAIYAELANRGVDACALGGANHCSILGACSIHKNLAGATGVDLERYQQEKALDGTTYVDWTAADFKLPTTTGQDLSLSDYAGRPVAMVFLAGHCSHSLSTLPILNNLQEKYRATDLAILPVYVNSGSVEDILSWSSILNLDLALAVDDGPSVANAYESFLVPSVFLIDRDGNITKRLVGFKDSEQLDVAIQELIS